MDQVPRIELNLPGRLENVALAGLAVRAICSYHLFSEEEAFLLELAVCEALNNVISHSLAGLPEMEVRLLIVLHNDQVVFRIQDNGREAYLSPPGFLEVAPLADHGRGLGIISGIVDTLSLERIGNANILTLTKHASKAAQKKGHDRP